MACKGTCHVFFMIIPSQNAGIDLIICDTNHSIPNSSWIIKWYGLHWRYYLLYVSISAERVAFWIPYLKCAALSQWFIICLMENSHCYNIIWRSFHTFHSSVLMLFSMSANRNRQTEYLNLTVDILCNSVRPNNRHFRHYCRCLLRVLYLWYFQI